MIRVMFVVAEVVSDGPVPYVNLRMVWFEISMKILMTCIMTTFNDINMCTGQMGKSMAHMTTSCETWSQILCKYSLSSLKAWKDRIASSE